MKRLRWVVLCVAGLMFTGCYPLFLQPLLTEKDVVMDAGFVGVWQKVGGEDEWTVEAARGQEYRVSHRDGKETETLVVRIGRLGSGTFLEMRGEKNPDDSQAIPGHSLWRIRREGDALEVRPLKPEYFEGLIQAGKLGFAQVVRKEFVVFTGTTGEVRAFLAGRLEDQEMYQDAERYRRMAVAGAR